MVDKTVGSHAGHDLGQWEMVTPPILQGHSGEHWR
jgi:hypothetical protein